MGMDLLLEKWLLHEAGEVYNYWSCVEFEGNPRIKKIWERFLDYELGHLQFVRELFESTERRDAAELLPARLPDPIQYRSQREFVQEVLGAEVDLRARGTEIVPKDELPRNSPSIAAARQLNAEGSPSELVAAGWIWTPGTELTTGRSARASGKNGNGHQRRTP